MPGWWNRRDQELPEELRDMTPEQMLDIMNKAREVDTLRGQLGERDQRLDQQQSDMDAIRAQLNTIDANRRSEPAPVTPATPAQIAWEDDPDAAFNQRLAPQFAARDAILLQSAATSARLAAEQQIRTEEANEPKKRGRYKLWVKYQKEIEDVMKQQNPATHAMVQTWMHAFTYVLGQHADELVEMARNPENPFFSEVPSGGTPPPSAPPEDQLTPAEEAIARKMRIDPKRYLEQRKKMQIAGETHS